MGSIKGWSYMEQLTINPIELTGDNIVLPQVMPGAENLLVYVKNPEFKHIAYYVNISGGLVVMGLDEGRVLKDIEFNIKRSNWEEEKELSAPTEYTYAGLEFTNINERSNEIDTQVLARTNQTRSVVWFQWGEEPHASKGFWLALSDYCFALIYGNRFSGFLIKLI